RSKELVETLLDLGKGLLAGLRSGAGEEFLVKGLQFLVILNEVRPLASKWGDYANWPEIGFDAHLQRPAVPAGILHAEVKRCRPIHLIDDGVDAGRFQLFGDDYRRTPMLGNVVVREDDELLTLVTRFGQQRLGTIHFALVVVALCTDVADVVRAVGIGPTRIKVEQTLSGNAHDLFHV